MNCYNKLLNFFLQIECKPSIIDENSKVDIKVCVKKGIARVQHNIKANKLVKLGGCGINLLAARAIKIPNEILIYPNIKNFYLS